MGLMRGAHEHEKKEAGWILRGAHEQEKKEVGGICKGGLSMRKGRFCSVSLLDACGSKLIIFKINR